MKSLKPAWTFLRRWPKTAAGLGALLLLVLGARLPRPLFDLPYSTVVEDREGRLLGARIASDGQWRFPAGDPLPQPYLQALIAFEDRRFFQHPGVDLRALARATLQNLRAGRVVSGGSTLSMQVVRLARGNPPRTYWRKMLEILQAIHLDLRYSKAEICRLYAAHAPFGGNVVGLEAASWRYFAKAPRQLSWSEAATLAVLPNQPGLIHPGRNRHALRKKRDRLLDHLLDSGQLDSLTWSLARAEPLPQAPHPLPQWVPHLLQRADLHEAEARLRSSIALDLQRQSLGIVARHHRRLGANRIQNLAALILDAETGEALAYIGNAPDATEARAVDLATAPRSTGSILKPFLYAMALQDGKVLPTTLLRDVPYAFDHFRPRNFHRDFDGLVPARQALQRSLNVPMVFLLQDYGLENFHADLTRLGLATVNRPPGHYGLSLILGGAEATLWDLAGAYASMARVLNHHYRWYGQYSDADWHGATYRLSGIAAPSPATTLQPAPALLDAASIWHTFQAMERLERPAQEGRWQAFTSSRRIAWKTGTSFGFRDAWAIGLDGRYVVAVWAGNADGEGRPGLTGIQAAAPLLFDLFDLLPPAPWFEPPLDELVGIAVCRESGFRALPHCPADTLRLGRGGLRAGSCPYHKRVHLTADGHWQLRRDCAEAGAIVHQHRLVLPPREEFFYRRKHPEYRPLPPLHPGCAEGQRPETDHPMQLIYPFEPTRVLIPIRLDGRQSEIVFRLAHRNPEVEVHWHLGDRYLGSTRQFHEVSVRAAPGTYRLLAVDAHGYRLQETIEILPRPN